MRDNAGISRRLRMSVSGPATATEGRLEPAEGRLILVSCADPSRLDLVLRTVQRRLRGNSRLTFIEPISTRRLPAGGGVVLSRSSFACLDRAGALPLVWHSAGHRHGHTVNLLARLSTGETVVTGASFDIERQLQALWPDVRLIRLETGTDRLRAGLSPRACLSRLAGDLARQTRLGRLVGDRCDCRVRDDGDLARVVRGLSAAIEAQLPVAAAQLPVRPARRRGRSAPGRADKPQAVVAPAA